MKQPIEPQKHPKKSNSFQTIRLVAGLIFVSLTVYVAFRMFACDKGSLICNSLYEWEEIIGAIAIVLVSIISLAIITIALIKLISGTNKEGVDWSALDESNTKDN